jgi:hypothetical protein
MSGSAGYVFCMVNHPYILKISTLLVTFVYVRADDIFFISLVV